MNKLSNAPILCQLNQEVRVLFRRPWQSLPVVLLIAIGVGFGSAYYSVTKALLFRPMPFDPEGRLVGIEQRLVPSGTRLMISHQNVNDLRQQSGTLEGVAVYQGARGSIFGTGQAEYAYGMAVDHYFFPLLGVAPALGRGFTVADEQPGAGDTILLSYPFWQRSFAGDQAIVGREILLDKRPYTVIGVMPESFYFPFIEQAEEDFWLPLSSESAQLTNYDKYGIARIKSDTSLRQAQAEMEPIAARMRQTNPGHERHSFNLLRYREVVVQRFRPMLLNIGGALLCVFLMVTVNAAIVLLAEGMRYRREVAIRFSLGATDSQIVRLSFIRALTLAVAGGLVGSGLAWVVIILVRRLLPPGIPGAAQVELNMRMLGFGAIVSLAIGALAGLWPAMAATRELHKVSLNTTHATVVANPRQESRRSLVVLQLTFSAALLVVTGFFAVSFYHLLKVDPGIRMDHRLLVTIQPTDPDLKRMEPLQQFFLNIKTQLLVTSGVQAVSISSYPPLGVHGARDFRIRGVPPPKNMMEWMAQDNIVSTNYFEELGIPLLKGRFFSDEDRREGKLVIIVNRAFAEHFLGGDSILGWEICISSGKKCPWREIVGMVANAHEQIDTASEPAYFIPFSQALPEQMASATFTVRTGIAPTAVVGSIRKEVLALAARAIGTGPYTMEEIHSRQLMAPRNRVWFLVVIAVLTLVLAAMGVYGVIAADVEQRRREIGLRVALGASPQRIALLFYRQMLSMLFPGLVVGLTGATMIVRYIASTLFGATSIDTMAYCGATLVLSFAAAMATALPVRRALRVSTVEVLRTE